MPRLLILCEYPTLLGGERSMLATLPAVRMAGFDVRVASPGGGELEHALYSGGVDRLPLNLVRSSGERLPLSEARTAIESLLERNTPDLVHANSLSMSRIAGPVAAAKAVPCVGHLRDIIKLSRQSIHDLNTHQRLVAVSMATRDWHIAQGIDGERCVVSYNGVDLEQFRLRDRSGYLHAALGLPPSARLIAVIGQLGLRKGVDIALKAAARISEDFREVHWLLVGERTSSKQESREYELALHAAANAEKLRGRVHFLGQRNDVRELLNECDLLVHAARQEPLGRVLLEAAASGLPVVATDVGGNREIFRSEADGGVIVPVDDANRLATVVMELLRDDERREQMGVAARRRAESTFDVRDAARRLIQIYQSVLTLAPELLGSATSI